MKYLAVLLLLISPLSWSQKNALNEQGRALANYQVCSQIATNVNDEAMLNYYLKMFNDSQLSALTLPSQELERVYFAWQKSEQVLLSLDKGSLLKICLSRFDLLSREMLNSHSIK